MENPSGAYLEEPTGPDPLGAQSERDLIKAESGAGESWPEEGIDDEVHFYVYETPAEQVASVRERVEKWGVIIERPDERLSGDKIFIPDKFSKLLMDGQSINSTHTVLHEYLVWDPAKGEMASLTVDVSGYEQGSLEKGNAKSEKFRADGWQEVERRRGIQGSSEYRYYYKPIEALQSPPEKLT